MTGIGSEEKAREFVTQLYKKVPVLDAGERGSAVTLFACSLFFGQSTGVLLMAQSVDMGWLAYAFTAAAVGVTVLGVLVYRLVGRH